MNETIKNLLEKSRNAIAVHQLKMKKLAFNDGVVRTRSRSCVSAVLFFLL